MCDYVKTSVLVPATRVEEFYEFYAGWLSGQTPAPSATIPTQSDLHEWSGDADDEEEIACAEIIWNKLSVRAKAMFEYLARNPDVRFTATELADHLSISNGMYGVAGVLAWPARHAQAVGYEMPVSFEPGPHGEGAHYWMPARAAAIFATVMGR